MHTKKILCHLLLIASPTIMANPVYQTEPVNTSHHEATAGGVGLVAGSLIAGPLGAIIGGSLGVLSGYQQTQTNTITEQQHFITELELDLALINTELSQSKVKISQLESTQQQLQDSIQHYDTNVGSLLSSYHFDTYFLSNRDDIQVQAQYGLLKLASLLKNNPNITAHIEAHSDWRGSNDHNFLLAQNRLDSVAQYLSIQGVNNAQLQSTNYGENKNMQTGLWGEELFYDRRVTITLSDFNY